MPRTCVAVRARAAHERVYDGGAVGVATRPRRSAALESCAVARIYEGRAAPPSSAKVARTAISRPRASCTSVETAAASRRAIARIGAAGASLTPTRPPQNDRRLRTIAHTARPPSQNPIVSSPIRALGDDVQVVAADTKARLSPSRRHRQTTAEPPAGSTPARGPSLSADIRPSAPAAPGDSNDAARADQRGRAAPCSTPTV